MRKLLPILVIALFATTSCKTQSISCSHENDSVRVETRIDSVIIYKWDSIIQTERVRHDTILLTSEKWSIRWRDKIVEVHDTIRTTETETIVQPQPYVPEYNKNCTRGFWVLLVILIVIIAIWILKKYIRLKTGGFIK